MSEEEMRIREEIYQDLMAFQKDFYKRRNTAVGNYGHKEVCYISNGIKMAAKLVKAGNKIGI